MLDIRPTPAAPAYDEPDVTFGDAYESRRGFWAIELAAVRTEGAWLGTFEGRGTTVDGDDSIVEGGRFRVIDAP